MIELIRKFIHFLRHDLWRIDLVQDSRLRALGVETLRVTHLLIKGIRADHCMLRAAALTYATLMALAPFLIILFSIANAIGYAAARSWVIESIQSLPDQQKGFITALLQNLDGVSPAMLGGITGVVFLYIVFKLLSAIEESFNQIWGVQTPRSLLGKVRNYISVLVVAPVLMLLARTASGTLSYTVNNEWLGPFVRTLLQLAPVLVMTLAFVAVFLFLPNTRVRFRAALTGALASATLAILLQDFLMKFGSAVFSSEKYSVYGSFAAVPVFLLWMYLNWGILLFGAELAFAIQNRETYAAERLVGRASTISRLEVAVLIMQEAVLVFRSGDAALDIARLSREQHIPQRLINRVIEVLVRGGFLAHAVVEGEDRCVLLRDPNQIYVKQIFDLVNTDGVSPKELGLTGSVAGKHVLEVVNSSLEMAVGSMTMQQLVDNTTD
ncbi:MAG: YihY/virulence factor BrkB family protein [Pontiellaceae bacterium]|nr:YihY/virulence factor BrkB family protein [Pontiellaceae bacterium]